MDDDDESHIDMEAMMAEINEKDPNATSIMTFTKDKITFRSSVDDSNDDMSDSSNSIDSKHQSVEAGDIPRDTTAEGGDKPSGTSVEAPGYITRKRAPSCSSRRIPV